MIIFQYDIEQIPFDNLSTIHKVLAENLGEEKFIMLPKGIDVIYSDSEICLPQGDRYMSNIARDFTVKNKNLYKGKTVI